MYKSEALTMLYLFEKFTFGLRYFRILRTHTTKTRARALYVIAGLQRGQVHASSVLRLRRRASGALHTQKLNKIKQKAPYDYKIYNSMKAACSFRYAIKPSQKTLFILENHYFLDKNIEK